MGLFDMPQGKAGQTRTQQDPYEDKLKELNAKKIRIVRQIGEMFIEESEKKDMSGTRYEALLKEYADTKKESDHTVKLQLAARGLRKCDSCGAELSIESAFCNKCGAKQEALESELAKTSKVCPNCGAPLDDDTAFCGKCGYKL